MIEPGPLLVIQNDPTCPLGWFGDWFAAAGVPVDVRRGFADDDIPADTRGFAAVIVLGGEMGANDNAMCPWLAPTGRLLRAAVDSDTPVLGICLGHQLAAVALGGTVEKNPSGQAVGLTPVTLTDAGRTDPLLGSVAPGSAAVQWNADIVTVPPPGAVVLAVCPDGSPQAIRFAPRAWGVQFHPEASPEIFRSWIADAAAGATGPSADAARAERAISEAEADLRSAWRPFAEGFARMCGFELDA